MAQIGLLPGFSSYILYFRPEGISLNLNRQEEKLQFCFIEKLLYIRVVIPQPKINKLAL